MEGAGEATVSEDVVREVKVVVLAGGGMRSWLEVWRCISRLVFSI